MKNLMMGLAAMAMFVGCRNCCDTCRSCGGGVGGHAQNASQVPATPSTPAYAGKAMQQNATPASASGNVQGMMPMPQQQGMPMPNALSTKPAAMDTMQR
jgi:hypothetical protein